MAIKKNITKNCYGENVEFENAYIKVSEVNATNKIINALVCTFNQSQTELMDQKYYSFDADVSDASSNFIKQTYDYIKTLDEFDGAIDVLEEGQTL